MLGRQIIAVTDRDDLAPRVKPKQVRRKCNRDCYRFQIGRWKVDDQAGDFPASDALELIGDGSYVPIGKKRCTWVEPKKASIQKLSEITAEDFVQKDNFL